MESKVEMRKIFCDTLIDLAKADERICIVNSDSRQISGTRDFEQAYPDRAFNVGIAEANMVGVAAGLAVSGKRPFVHAFGPFMTRRVLDQLTISLAYSKLNAVLVGLSPGIVAEINGGTHQSYDDIAAVRGIANTTIVEPFDGMQLRQMIPALLDLDGPVYLRYDRAVAPCFYGDDYRYQLGRADILRKGSDVTLISSGIMLTQCLEAAQILKENGIEARVLNMHTIKPIDQEAIIQAARETRGIITVENHNIIGGLGSAVAEVLAENYPAPMRRIGIRDRFGEVGNRAYLRQCLGIDTGDIVKAAMEWK
ncbi:transketolase family protein [Lawsonibacter sp. OA9]|jgi:transketolase|uniref:Transketolase family protein n=1 Tax=Flintibacter hominis TaxID=2763048 RepID=A0A8J6IYR1_9FIRM|nr:MULTISPECIES: transketolase family protein [Eubacteriales]MBS5590796.1 transketolase family protein [Clostridiales bacterium]SCH80441.1 1-deoxy-D-xylulose-5-phosphate synthase [uncultured Clostridium sp.]SCJ33354.1 1-deoxy-D-xylulose-5-phosphate synthase [uncultured Flavonifractor sp.]MBC5723325.1 transketolase family protein [Flintibacter hominis]MCH1978646.1 transketolase family protein [Lawsonibacter sp. OA9]